jgi:hypothetical protein
MEFDPNNPAHRQQQRPDYYSYDPEAPDPLFEQPKPDYCTDIYGNPLTEGMSTVGSLLRRSRKTQRLLQTKPTHQPRKKAHIATPS